MPRYTTRKGGVDRNPVKGGSKGGIDRNPVTGEFVVGRATSSSGGEIRRVATKNGMRNVVTSRSSVEAIEKAVRRHAASLKQLADK